jgi:TonB family protein
VIRALATLFVLLVFFASVARADDAFAIEPPLARSNTEVPYPAGAQGDAAVIIELIIEPDGTVSSAEVIEGAEPFAEQARHAAREWRFSPARRAGAPIRARVRARVDFRQEPASADADAGASALAAPIPKDGGASDGGPPLIASVTATEVTVRGARREIGQTTMSADDVRQMPGAFGDPFRAVEAVPGMTPMLSGLSYFFIRGAPPNNNGYFLDGVRVPQLFHVGLGPGVIHPALVDRVEIHPGAAPASYGGVSGGVVAGSTRQPGTTFHGEANLRVFDVGALAETPFADGRGTALAAFRYGYPGPIVGLFSQIDLGYWDYQARSTWSPGARDTLGVFAFGSHDYLAHTESHGVKVVDFLSNFHRIDLRYDRALGEGRLRLAATLGYDSQAGSGFDSNLAPTYLTNHSVAVRFEWESQLFETFRLRTGAEARLDAYGFEQAGATSPVAVVLSSSVDPPPTNESAGVHADFVWRIAPGVELVPGARFDAYSSTRAGHTVTVPAVDPRLSARVTLAPSVIWLSTVGLAHQYPSLRVGGIPGFMVAGSGFPLGRRELQSAGQVSQGIEIGLPAGITITATGFLSGWWGMTELATNCLQLMPAELPPPGSGGPMMMAPQYACPNDNPVSGHAYGFELLARRPLSKRLGVWLSYTLSRSQREMHFITPQGGDALATVASEFDRTHVLNAMVGYDLGRRWRAGSRFVFYTGTPYSALSGNVPVPPYNAYRTPPFHRLDVRLEKSWPLGESSSIAFVIEGQNVTLSKETSALGTSCRSGPTEMTTCTLSTLGPITIPSVGVEAFF